MVIRVGIIGAHVGGVRAAGSWGVRAHIPALRALPMYEVSAVATSDIRTAREAAATFGIPHAFDDPTALVRHPDVDVVAVCVRVPEHVRLVSAAIEAGKHVYCEWPLAPSTGEAEHLLAIAQASGVRHVIGLQGRQSPAIAYLRDLLDQGTIGEIRGCALNHCVPWPTSVVASTAYLQTHRSGANYFTIPAGHTIDTVCHLLGPLTRLVALNRIRIAEIGQRDTNSRLIRDTPDQILVMGEFAGGATGVMRFEGSSAHGTGIRLEINGSRGDLLVTPAVAHASMMQIWDLKIAKTTGLGQFEELGIPDYYVDGPSHLAAGPAFNVARNWLALARAMDGQKTAYPDFSDAVELHRMLDRIAWASRQRVWAAIQ